MPVEGREIASLDFANLIGGPLNAIIEAQAKSAIATANFIREVAFDKEGQAIGVDFKYNRKGADGRDQEFTLSVPFLTMLPIPYITVDEAEIEFNAKITSTRESSSEKSFTGAVEASLGGKIWHMGASLKAKASVQRQSRSTEKEQRSFDMRVLVRVRSDDIPPGTERLLTALENAIEEKAGPVRGITGAITSVDGSTLGVSTLRGIGAGWQVVVHGVALGAVTRIDAEAGTIAVEGAPPETVSAGDTFTATPPPEPDDRGQPLDRV